MKKTTIIIMLLIILSKLIGFGRELLLTYYYGATYISDVYVISMTIPAVLFSFIGISITTTFIPSYVDVLTKRGKDEAIKFTNIIVNWVSIISLILIFIVFVFTDEILLVFASGFVGESKELAKLFTRITIFSIFFTGYISISKGFLNANKQFVAPSLIGIPLSIVVVFSVFLSHIYGLIMLPIGIVASSASQILILIYFNAKNGFKPYLKLEFNEDVKKVLFLMVPIILSSAVHEVNVIVDRTLASQIFEGGVSALYFANRINLFVRDIIFMALFTVSFPLLSRYISENNVTKFKTTFINDFNTIVFLTLPIIVGGILYSEQIIGLLYGRGAFDSTAISLTSGVLIFYLPGLIGIGIYTLCSKSMYAMKNTKTPVLISVIGMIINIILNIYLSKKIGINGLALSTTISATVTSLLGLLYLRKNIGKLDIKVFLILKIAVSTIIMAIISKFAFNLAIKYLSANLSLFLAIGTGFIIYIIVAYLIRVDELVLLVTKVKNRFVN